MPERYTADLAEELKGRGGNDLASKTSYEGGARNPSRGGGSHRRAYTLWHQGHGLLDICIQMGSPTKPQSETVVMYVCISSTSKGRVR